VYRQSALEQWIILEAALAAFYERPGFIQAAMISSFTAVAVQQLATGHMSADFASAFNMSAISADAAAWPLNK
jgi:hypothetical protein